MPDEPRSYGARHSEFHQCVSFSAILLMIVIANWMTSSRPENNLRPYTIGTTFPNRVLEDDLQTIKDAGLVKGVIVQRWV